MEIKIDQIVHLNSGSPDLTVIELRGEDLVVKYQSNDGETHQTIVPCVCVH